MQGLINNNKGEIEFIPFTARVMIYALSQTKFTVICIYNPI